MDNRRWLWIGASLLVAGVIFWAVGQAVNPSSGDAEFKKTLESMKQLKSFRGAYIESTSGTQHSERLWEVDCNHVIVHQQSHESQTNTDSPFEMKEDELLVGDQRYTRTGEGSWENTGYAGERGSAQWYCDNLARGTARDLLPDMFTMISHAMTEKGDKKTVNGVRCREWKFAVRSALAAQDGSLCIGLDDHLPYEMTMKDGGHYSYSDYNRPIQFEVPEAVLQPASSTNESN
jgi:hypothetical protein